MKRVIDDRNRLKSILLTIAATLFVIFIIIPLTFSAFDGSKRGNVARIPIEGEITGGASGGLGSTTVSSKDIVEFIKEADEDSQIKTILLDINSPGGSAVASDEIASAVKDAKKPVIALIHEAGASGAYWISSAADHIIANRMSITGSIGVISSYLEFSGLMEKYGVGYERLVSGDNKDIGVPYEKLSGEERNILQSKIDKIHEFFIQGVAENRNMDVEEVRKIATGEFYLGVEALQLGLIDQLGDADTAEEYMKENYHLKKIDYIVYQKKAGLLDFFGGVMSKMFFSMGEGISSSFLKSGNLIMT